MNITIIGTGYVGLVTGVLFAEKGHQVLCIENNIAKLKKLNAGNVPFYEPGIEILVKKNIKEKRLNFSHSISKGVKHGKIIFIAVGTPSLETGEADMSYIESVAKEVADNLTEYRLIVEKSTVPVHTSEKIQRTIQRYIATNIPFEVASNPEFLREGQAIEDAFQPDRIVIGVPSKKAEELMRRVYKKFNAPILVTNVNSAEIIKHAANSFLAMKISYINAIANICDLAGADVMEVAEGIGLDRRIGKHFLNAGIGYGGSCFPKDVDAFVAISKKLGYDFSLLQEVQKINKEQLFRFLEKIQEELWVIKNKTIAIWGLSFKPDTDDMREAPALKIIKKLLQKKANIRVFDPKTIKKIREILTQKDLDEYEITLSNIFKEVKLCDDPYEVARNVDCLLIVTEWEIFKNIDLDKLKTEMKQPIIIDGRNIFCPEKLNQKGFIYRSIGRK